MKVLLINGSPNEKGCTYTALGVIADALAENGVDSEIFQIGKAPVSGCLACGGCHKTKGRCVIEGDGVNAALALLEGADGLVIGSPVHFASPAGNLLSLLDRMYFAGRSMAHKPAAAIVSARRAGTTAALDVLNKYLAYHQSPVVGSTYWPMVHGAKPEDVLQDAEGVQTMQNLARNMAWLLKCIEAGREKGLAPPDNGRKARTNFIR